MENAAKVLLISAAVLALIGLALFALARLGVSDLPGTFKWKSKSGNVSVYAPIGLMIVVSVVGTILLNVLFRR
jgi:quinol-cytochrome oxidoreductase complex cytochrome b subunit